MTLREWLDVYTRNGDAQLVCAWRKRAWRAMRPVVEKFVADRDAGLAVSAGGLMADIDAAGEAAKIKPTTKRWTKERRDLFKILHNTSELWQPLVGDEAGICMVARDLVESERYAEAIALLKEQAPHVHNRPCPACGAVRGFRCVQMQRWDGQPTPQWDALRAAGENPGRHVLIVPHEARVS